MRFRAGRGFQYRIIVVAQSPVTFMTTFQSGRSFKVRVELAHGEVGFGRASVLDRQGNKIYVQLKTSKDENQVLPKGSRLWFVSDAPTNPFAGVWATTVTGTKIIGGHTVMECNLPKFEPQTQKRKTQRVALDCPVRLVREKGHEVGYDIRSRNISLSGIGLEAFSSGVDKDFPVGEVVQLILEGPTGNVPLTARVVRTDYNWLANRTTIGLEFVDVTDQIEKSLDQIYQAQGGTDPAAEPETQSAPQGLAGWVRSSKSDWKLVRSSGTNPEPERSGNGEVSEDDGKPNE